MKQIAFALARVALKAKVLFVAVFAIAMASMAHAAEPINVLRGGPVGAGVGLWAEAVADTLQKNGREAQIVGLQDCRQVSKWIQTNPGKPYAFMTYSDYALLDELKPDHPAACGYKVDASNLVTIAGRWWHFICGKKNENDSLTYLRTNDGLKIGVWNHPVGYTVLQQQMKKLGTSAKVIGFASGKQMLTAFNTGDIDYIVLSSENLVGSLKNPSCFATAADTFTAKAHMPDRVSYDQIEKMPFLNYGLWPMIAAGGGVDVELLRAEFATRPSKTYKDLVSYLVPETKPVKQQLADLNETALRLKGLIQ